MSLRDAISKFKTRKKVPLWITKVTLPPLADEQGDLSEDEVHKLLLMLRSAEPIPVEGLRGGADFAAALLKGWGVQTRHGAAHGWVTRAVLLGDQDTARVLEGKAALLADGQGTSSGLCVKALAVGGHTVSLVRLSHSEQAELHEAASEALAWMAREQGQSLQELVEAHFDWRAELLALTNPKKLPPWLKVQGLDLVGPEGPWDPALVLGLLRAAMGDGLRPYAGPARAAATRESRDRFCLALLERWDEKSFNGRYKWIRGFVELFGGDATALALEAHVVAWPGESETGRKRAIDFLEVFRRIGTDTALLVLLGLRQKVVAPSLIAAAKSELRKAARDRKLGTGALKDQLTPTCGLDRFGGRVFDYGPRHFQLVVDERMHPRLRSDGEALDRLPEPNDDDDPRKAAEARAAWAVLEGTLQEVMEVQAHRLEEDMVLARRWSQKEWTRWVFEHPLMVHFARRLVWARYEGGQVIQSFRATEDLELVDHDDEPVELGQGGHIGLPHPLDLSDAARAAWGEQLADYEVVQPFAQLGRSVFTLRGHSELDHYAKVGFRSGCLRDVLVLAEYEREPGLHRTWYEKTFPNHDLTARVHLSPGVYAGGATYDHKDQKVPSVSFRSGRATKAATEVPPAVLSEVMRDLEEALAAG